MGLARVALGILLALALSPAGAGCRRAPALPAAEEAAVRKAVDDHYRAKRDSRREVTIKALAASPGGAEVVVRIRFPDFHSVATEHRLILDKRAGAWRVVEEKTGP